MINWKKMETDTNLKLQYLITNLLLSIFFPPLSIF